MLISNPGCCSPMMETGAFVVNAMVNFIWLLRPQIYKWMSFSGLTSSCVVLLL